MNTYEEWENPGPNGQPRCPKCLNSMQNGIPADKQDHRRCATCKHVWKLIRRYDHENLDNQLYDSP